MWLSGHVAVGCVASGMFTSRYLNGGIKCTTSFQVLMLYLKHMLYVMYLIYHEMEEYGKYNLTKHQAELIQPYVKDYTTDI